MDENQEEELWPSEEKKVIVVMMKLLWTEATLYHFFFSTFLLCFHVALLLSCVQFCRDLPVYPFLCKESFDVSDAMTLRLQTVSHVR